MKSISEAIDAQLAQDVREGLSDHPKHLPSRYFYDDKGSEIFRQIMRMDTYYLTDCEYEIFDKQAAGVLEILSRGGQPFRLVEFGAGDGLKTKLLLKDLLARKQEVTYMPIDISKGAIDKLSASLADEMPDLDVEPVIGEYFKALHRITEQEENGHKSILFVGSNIGNFQEAQAVGFLKALAAEMKPEDRVLIGFDLKKDPKVILDAYDDPEGITLEFNMNLLQRFNRELGADFDLNQWMHYPTYNPLNGETRSYLISRCAQQVNFRALDFTVTFEAWEPIWMELSQKYDEHMIEALAEQSGFRVVKNFYDRRGYFVDSVWELK